MRIVVLGVAGMLGHKMWQRLRLRYGDDAVFGTLREPRENLSACDLFRSQTCMDRLDAREFRVLEEKLDELMPTVIVNCIGITLRRGDSNDPIATIEVNSLLPHRLAHWCGRRSARLIHISTDCVFQGSRGNYAETDPADAQDLYGRTKALGEPADRTALTLRTSIVGRELRGQRSLLEWLLANKGARVSGFRKALWSGVSTLYLSDVVGELIDRFPRLSGLYHLTGETLSKCDLLVHLNRAFAAGVTIIPEESHENLRNLDGSRFVAETGLRPPPWEEMAGELAADAARYPAWRKALSGGE